MQSKIRIIAHTHWDKEWYFTNSRSVIYSLSDFDEIICTLEKNSDFTCFLLDGQLSIIEEYLELHPNMKERLVNLVKLDKLIIGPWYTQPDTLVISGENLIRNLQYGIHLSKKYGKYQNIGYLPDSFGMSAQMPQIYKKFDFDYAFFRRGTAKHLIKKREFIWEALDGSIIKSHNLHHYGNMAYPPNEKEKLIKFFNEKVSELSSSSESAYVLLFNGEDQKPIRKNLPDLVRIGLKNTPYDIKITSLKDALDEIFESIDYKSVPVVKGEFTFGQYSRTHKSIFSSRADLKKLNNYLENYIINIVEPLCSLAYKLGIKYETELLDVIWKEMLLNSAHDSIGNCNSDKTNFDIYTRYLKAKSLSEELVEFIMRNIGQRVKQENITQFQIYNLIPYERTKWMELKIYSPFENFDILNSEGKKIKFEEISKKDVSETYLKKSLKEVGVDNAINSIWTKQVDKLYEVYIRLFAEKIPAFGYETFNIKKSDFNLKIKKYNFTSMENERYKIYIKDKRICLLDKNTGFKSNDWICFIDDGDEGDSYDYSEPANDWKIESKIINFNIEHSENFQSMLIEFELLLPKNLLERECKINSIKQRLNLEISFIDLNTIKMNITTVNNADEHRLRLVVNTEKENEYSIADTQFGTINRPNYLIQVEKWKEEKWDEKPRTIEPMISFVSNGMNKGDIVVFTESVREYQFIGEKFKKIALTLYRSTPFLGKPDLNDRPGRESGTVAPTPDARLIDKKIESTYYVQINDGNSDEVLYAQKSKEIFTPFIGYQAAPFRNNTDNFVLSCPSEINLNLQYSLFELPKNVVLSSVTKSRETEDLVIRYFNPSMTESIKKIHINSKKLKSFREVNLLLKENCKKDEVNKCEFISVLAR